MDKEHVKESARQAVEATGKFAVKEGEKILKDTVVQTYRKNVNPIMRSLRWILQLGIFALVLFVLLLIAAIALLVQLIFF